MPTKSDGNVFQLAVAMAGAVSGGAYQGGAMDFLIQALDAWNRAKAAGQDPDAVPDFQGLPLPSHQVVLRGFAGTSAGSYNAAIASVALRYEFPPVVDAMAEKDDGSANPFFEAWVNRVDISNLLQVKDFKQPPPDCPPGREVLSLLDCTVIDRTVDDVLDMGGAADVRHERKRAWVSEPLAVRLTLGNLRGVPYGFSLGHEDTWTHCMTLHADTRDFAIAGRGTCATTVDPTYLSLPARNSSADWRALGQAAKASAAFPFALRPRLIERMASDYEGRVFIDPGDGTPDFPRSPRTIRPLAGMPASYAFMSMDGGIMNNEPLEVGRALLLDKPEDRNVRSGIRADRAVLMIDPFVDPADIKAAAEDLPLPKLLMPLMSAWKAQCRFKPEELALAGDRSIYSRFMIAPKRSRPAECPTDAEAPHPLASGGLGAFLGFFDRAFRVHDFQLGRRNAQQFLRRSFALPVENPIVKPWWDGLDEDQRALAVKREWAFADQDGIMHVPLVPLMQSVRSPIPELPWPSAPDPQSFRDRLGKRLDKVVNGLVRELDPGWIGALLIKAAWNLKFQGKLVETAMDKLAEAFQAQCFRRRS